MKIKSFKTILLSIVILSLISSFAFSQNVGVNATASTPDASAMLDVAATNKGLLVPRVSLTGTTDATTISSPAVSLLVYNTASAGSGTTSVTPGYYYNSGTVAAPVWTTFVTATKFTVPFSSNRNASTMPQSSQNPFAIGTPSTTFDLGNPASAAPNSNSYVAYSIYTSYSNGKFNGLTAWYAYPAIVNTTFWLYRYRQTAPNSNPVQGTLLGTVTVNVTNAGQVFQINIAPGAITDLIKGDMLLLYGQNQSATTGGYTINGSIEIINQ